VTPVVLVADDHASLRSLVATMLRRTHGWEVVEAEDGEAALAAARETTFDLAILDERMPGYTGTEVARELRAASFAGPIMLFSAYVDPRVETTARELDVRTVQKSDIAELPDIARDLLGSA
jgi:CheY-like chemotaxis protein